MEPIGFTVGEFLFFALVCAEATLQNRESKDFACSDSSRKKGRTPTTGSCSTFRVRAKCTPHMNLGRPCRSPAVPHPNRKRHTPCVQTSAQYLAAFQNSATAYTYCVPFSPSRRLLFSAPCAPSRNSLRGTLSRPKASATPG